MYCHSKPHQVLIPVHTAVSFLCCTVSPTSSVFTTSSPFLWDLAETWFYPHRQVLLPHTPTAQELSPEFMLHACLLPLITVYSTVHLCSSSPSHTHLAPRTGCSRIFHPCCRNFVSVFLTFRPTADFFNPWVSWSLSPSLSLQLALSTSLPFSWYRRNQPLPSDLSADGSLASSLPAHIH